MNKIQRKYFSMKKARKLTNNTMAISFKILKSDKETFEEVKEKVKSLPGRKWKNVCKYWVAPIIPQSLKALKDWGFKLDTELTKILEKKKTRLNIKKIKEKIENFGISPLKHQIRGIAKMERFNGRVLLADEMGLGKTMQAITHTLFHQDLFPILIINPASLKLMWRNEIKKWVRKDAYIINGRRKLTKKLKEKFCIINYDILQEHEKWIKEQNFKIVIIDECHYIKNPKALRTKTVKKLVKKIKYINALSGTPIENKPIEMFTILNILRPDIFPSRWRYGMKYCGAKHNGFGWDFNGASNQKELHELLKSTCMIRRLKKDELYDLPDKLPPVIIPMEISNKKEYNLAKENFKNWYEDKKGKEKADNLQAEVLVQLSYLRQIAAIGKKYQILEWIDNFLETGKKLVIFAIHYELIDFIYEKYNNIIVKIDGRNNADERQKAVDDFQNDDNIRLFIGNIEAAGVGITLTAANDVAHVEFPFVPGKISQGTDRCHRIGQKNIVTPWYLVGADTIEEDIIELLEKKQKIIDQILDGKDKKDNINIQREIIKKIYKKY